MILASVDANLLVPVLEGFFTDDKMTLNVIKAITDSNRQLLATGFDRIESAIKTIQSNRLAATISLQARISLKLHYAPFRNRRTICF